MARFTALDAQGGALFTRRVKNKEEMRLAVLNSVYLARVHEVKYINRVYSIKKIYSN